MQTLQIDEMKRYSITSSGVWMGEYFAESQIAALDLYAQNAGYTDYADVIAQFGDDAIAKKID